MMQSNDTKNYIKWIRSKVGHEKIILVHAGGCIFNEQGEVLVHMSFQLSAVNCSVIRMKRWSLHIFRWIKLRSCFAGSMKK